MDPQFEELAERLKSGLATVVADKVKSELASVIAEKLDAAEQRLTARVDRAEDELKRHSRTQMESLEEKVKLAAEGYGATLDSIEGRLKDLAVKWDTKIADHELVLANHARRFVDLEQSR